MEYISELGFSDSGFIIELYRYDTDTTFTGWLLSTKTDTAAFKTGIPWDANEYVVVTTDDLVHPLVLRNQGDVISLISPEGYAVLELAFGDAEYARCAAPRGVGESISSYSTYFYYLDSSPTFGSVNDSVNAMGSIEGMVTDTTGTPIIGATVHIGQIMFGRETVTDSTGFFHLQTYAARMNMRISAENFIDQSRSTGQIWPDSTITINIQLESSISDIKTERMQIPNLFRIEPNYPNPFNAETRFTYYLPEKTYVTVGIFDLQGRLVERIFRGEQAAARYDVAWNANNLSSGVYIFRVTTPKQVLQRKCTLIK